tara:strand:+ start:494 stop:769 length:276 start_codon:yes stop_codon:yes gene_type:complete
MTTIEQAIMSLRPNVQWTLNGDDVEGITWHTKGAEPLTTAEVEAEVQRLETVAAARLVSDAANRAAAIEHAKSLGFTDAMIAVMYPTLLEA